MPVPEYYRPYLEFVANPLGFMRDHVVICDAGIGNGTVTQIVALSMDGPTLRLDHNPSFEVLATRPIWVPTLLTQTRATNTQGIEIDRRAPVERFGPAHWGANLWLTSQQTGCTVLILDWGNRFSMAHIAPYESLAFGRLTRRAMTRYVNVAARVQSNALLCDASGVVQNSLVDGNRPRRYILVESQFAINAGSALQVLGVCSSNTWQFYMQRLELAYPAGWRVVSVDQLTWRAWSSDPLWRRAAT